MSKTLGPRLQKIVELIKPGLPVWDICCDHGYVGLQALAMNLSSDIHFVDAVPEIVAALEKKFLSSDYDAEALAGIADGDENCIKTQVQFYKLKGEKLNWEKVSGNIIITGVGVDSIISILNTIPEGRLSYCRFILGPQNRPNRLRSYIMARGLPFDLGHEWIVQEGTRQRHLFLSAPKKEADTVLKQSDGALVQKV